MHPAGKLEKWLLENQQDPTGSTRDYPHVGMSLMSIGQACTWPRTSFLHVSPLISLVTLREWPDAIHKRAHLSVSVCQFLSGKHAVLVLTSNHRFHPARSALVTNRYFMIFYDMCGNHGFANAQIGFIVLVVEDALCSHQKKTKHPQASPETPFNPSGALYENPLK